MSSLAISTAATTTCVTLAELKVHLRIDTASSYTVEDTDLNNILKAAHQHVEDFTGRTLLAQTYTWCLDSFPTELTFPKPPLSSVSAINYLDDNGETQTVSTSVYSVDAAALPGSAYLKYNQSWPSTRSIKNAVSIVYIGGYGSVATAVPETLRMAVKQLAAHWYVNREAVSSAFEAREVPIALNRLLWAEKLVYPGDIDQ